MSDSNACGMLTPERVISGTAVLNGARTVLEVLRERGELIGDLPERLAVLEGMLDTTWHSLETTGDVP